MLVDLGTHKWLRASREENYSGWLAWVLEQVGTAIDVQFVLGIDNPDTSVENFPNAAVTVEQSTEEGHEGRAGRIDIIIEFGEQLAIALEVKTCSAERADTLKQEGYRRSFLKHPAKRKELILLVTEAEKATYFGFAVLRWERLCLNLRRSVGRVKERRGLMAAAMVLAFVGAVEQNLLGFRVEGSPGLTTYLEACLAKDRER